MSVAHVRITLLSAILLLGLALAPSRSLADSGAEHQVRQAWPIQLGVTGGSIADSSSAFCCGGTLGALVQDAGGVRYILSNNHVIARSNEGQLDEPIIHPGLIDQTPVCSPNSADTVANLSAFVPIRFSRGRNILLNEVDAAIARVVSGAVREDGALVDIGGVSANPVAAFVGQGVQKSGRTTGHTLGSVAALNVTVDVGYSKSCGGAANQVARFVNQIRVTPGSFSAGGDSGSLVVEDGAVDPATGLPRAVGLLFAGNSTSTLANPIQSALEALNVSLVDGELPEPGPNGSIAGIVTRASDGASIEGALVSVDTGQSATTDPDGAYAISGIPVGLRTVTAEAIGYEAQSAQTAVNENEVSEANFALTVATAPAQSIVQCVVWNTSGGKDKSKDLSITLRIKDDMGGPVAGAQVNIDVFLNGALYGSGSGATTNSAGEATYNARNAPDGNYTTTVTNVISNLAFEGSTPENLFRKGVDSTPDEDCRGDAPQPSSADAQAARDLRNAMGRAARIKAANDNALFAVDGVVGTGVGLGANGKPVIEVYLNKENASARRRIPARVEDVETSVIVTGPFVAF